MLVQVQSGNCSFNSATLADWLWRTYVVRLIVYHTILCSACFKAAACTCNTCDRSGREGMYSIKEEEVTSQTVIPCYCLMLKMNHGNATPHYIASLLSCGSTISLKATLTHSDTLYKYKWQSQLPATRHGLQYNHPYEHSSKGLICDRVRGNRAFGQN